MKSVLLLEPVRLTSTNRGRPLGLLTVHNFLKSKDIISKYIDLFELLKNKDFSNKKIENQINLLFNLLKKDIAHYDCIGISVIYKGSFRLVSLLCKNIKKYFPNKKILLGGSYITFLYLNGFLTIDYFRRYFDFAILFDGELALYRLLKTDFKQLENIPNLIFVKNNNLNINKIVNGLCLDKLPLIKDSYDLYSKIFEYETGRGCYWNNCAFCNFSQRLNKYREKSIKRIVSDLKKLNAQIKGKKIRFINNCMPVKQALNLSNEIILKKLAISWFTYMRFEKSLSFKVLKKMKEAGCFAVWCGLESGDSKINNKVLNKGIDLKDAERILRYCKSLGIHTIINSLTGIPGETFFDALKTTKFFLKNQKHISAVTLFPLVIPKYCDHFKNPSKYKILKIINKDNETYSFIPKKGFFYRAFLMTPFLIINYLYFNLFTNVKFIVRLSFLFSKNSNPFGTEKLEKIFLKN